MKINEIFLSKKERRIVESNKFEKTFDDLFHDFLREMASNTDSYTTLFLMKHPLYRADRHNPKYTKVFGIKKIRKDREPLDTPKIFSEILDDFLRSKGLKALRKNSIFATGKKELASEFLDISSEFQRDLFVIFPPKNFSFTWNSHIEDFHLDKFDEDGMMDKIVDFSYEEIVKKSLDFYNLLMNMDWVRLNKNEISKIMENVLYEKNLQKRSETAKKIMEELISKSGITKSSFYFNLMKLILKIFPERKIYKILKIPRNEITEDFDDKYFEEAVKSGNEIMITDDIFYYFEEDFFSYNKKFIEEKLREFYNLKTSR